MMGNTRSSTKRPTESWTMRSSSVRSPRTSYKSVGFSMAASLPHGHRDLPDGSAGFDLPVRIGQPFQWKTMPHLGPQGAGVHQFGDGAQDLARPLGFDLVRRR